MSNNVELRCRTQALLTLLPPPASWTSENVRAFFERALKTEFTPEIDDLLARGRVGMPEIGRMDRECLDMFDVLGTNFHVVLSVLQRTADLATPVDTPASKPRDRGHASLWTDDDVLDYFHERFRDAGITYYMADARCSGLDLLLSDHVAETLGFQGWRRKAVQDVVDGELFD